MTTKQLKSAAKNNTFENVNYLVQNSGLELELIQDLSFLKMWSVKNNKEITHITNTLDIANGNSIIGFCWNN